MIREGGIREYKIERDHSDWRLFVRPFYPGSSWLEIDAVQAPGGRWSSFNAVSAFALTIHNHTVATVICSRFVGST
jgi:hypothetical protein